MCASGNAALLTAKMWIDAGMVDDVLVVATDVSGTPENARSFVDLGVVIVDRPPLEACRPFQEGSRGFVGGEASVGLIVSGHSEGAYADVRSGAMSHRRAPHAISLAAKPEQIRACYEAALRNSGVDKDEVVYFNAHGPGTRQCDTAEAALFDELFPDAAGIYSFKPLVGHCQAGGRGGRGGDPVPRLRGGHDPRASAGGAGAPPPPLGAGRASPGRDLQVLDRHGRLQHGARPRRARRLSRPPIGPVGTGFSTPGTKGASRRAVAPGTTAADRASPLTLSATLLRLGPLGPLWLDI